MVKLIFFEMDKMWKKRSFVISAAVILIINIFLLWYTNQPKDYEPGLDAYKMLQNDLSEMSEQEKYIYIEKTYQDIQNISFVEDILNYRSIINDIDGIDDEWIKELVSREMAENPGVFERYYGIYQKGNYLKYTDSLMKENDFLTEIHDEMIKVSGYQEYLDSVQETKDKLNEISIFTASGSKDSFSSRNIEKSAADYDKMRDVKIKFYPSKGIAAATKNNITDILLILAVFLFVSGMIYEEKEKKLFYITRATVKGRANSIAAKLTVLLLNCFIMSALMYIENLTFFACTTGIGSLSASIQSAAPFMESNLHISVFGYVLLSVITKMLIMFCFGSLLTFISVITKQSFMPFLTGAVIIFASGALYNFIPAYSAFNYLKYLNFIGLFRTENLYGGYLNFNFFGYPSPRYIVSIAVIILFFFTGVLLSVFSFLKFLSVETGKIKLPFTLKFKPHTSLLKHESYKMLIVNRGIIILIIFIALIGYSHISNQYKPSTKEEYYQDIMMRLEGEITEEKRALIYEETNRYHEAFVQIDSINRMVASGELDKITGENIKSQYYAVASFYPAFQKVLGQYEHIRKWGGVFVYDTGYMYLFGIADDSNFIDLLLLLLCLVLCFGNTMSMEYQKKSWNILSATERGKKQIIKNKKIICFICTVILSLITFAYRIIQITKTFPMNQVLTSIRNIPSYRNFSIDIPIIGWILVMILVQVITLLAAAMFIIFLSDKLKSQLQTLFVAVLILIIPLILKMMGLEFAQYASLYPAYTITGFALNSSSAVSVVYVLIDTAVIILCSVMIGQSIKK